MAIAEAGWAFYVRAKINDGEIGDGPGWLHPLAVARSVLIAKASAWVGALVLGWWLGVLVYLLPRRSTLRVAGEDTAGAVVAAGLRARAVGRRAVAPALLQVTGGAAGQRRRRNAVGGRQGRVAESPKWSTREVTCGGYSRPMTDPTRSARSRRGGRRPGWLLLTVLLVLAIGASSALVFTNRVELLKLAVILALWAAVVAAFVSVIYRRQSDMDQAKARDLKLVYDLQLDREISARREYELSVETQLRRELVSELRAQAADEVAGLRAELAALRANLEILFDADLSHRPAIETERSTVAPTATGQPTPRPRAGSPAAGSIPRTAKTSNFRTEESPIIDVPAEPHPPEYEWASSARSGGAHRLPSDVEREGRRHAAEEPVTWSPPPPHAATAAPARAGSRAGGPIPLGATARAHPRHLSHPRRDRSPSGSPARLRSRLAAGPRRRAVDSGRGAGQQLGVAA